MVSKEKIEKSFLKDEALDGEVYSRLSKIENNSEIRKLLQKLVIVEKRHVKVWRALLGKRKQDIGRSVFANLKILEMLLVRRLLGVAFVVKFLERHEGEDLKNYMAVLQNQPLSNEERRRITKLVNEEVRYERTLTNEAAKYKGELSYTQAIILGLNDGLVEILAIIAGIAMVATTSFSVVVLGLIAGISGSLSMSGGVYLSFKSEGLVNERKRRQVSLRKGAFYAGIWYFIGALLAILPFILGLNGFEGVLLSIVLVCAALTIASAIIAVMSGTGIKKRVFEMLIISLGAALVTILFGIFANLYLKISI